jgi:MFS family permease
MASIQTRFSVFSLSYGASAGVDRSAMLTVVAGSIALTIFAIPAAGHLSDGIGRKRTMMISCVGCAVSIFGYLWAVSTTNLVLIGVFAFINMTLFYTCYNGV